MKKKGVLLSNPFGLDNRTMHDGCDLEPAGDLHLGCVGLVIAERRSYGSGDDLPSGQDNIGNPAVLCDEILERGKSRHVPSVLIGGHSLALLMIVVLHVRQMANSPLKGAR